MVEVTWAELVFIMGTGVLLTGRKDLPKVANFMGHNVGRLVGFMQAARARADQFAAQSELRHLQAELRSGLRELDQVKTELAVASQGSRGFGPAQNIVKGGGRGGGSGVVLGSTKPPVANVEKNAGFAQSTNAPLQFDFKAPAQTDQSSSEKTYETLEVSIPGLAPTIQTERATMEIEWERQGIGYKSTAERGAWLGSSGATMAGGSKPVPTTGSEILANVMQESLVFDQYDRVVGKQEAETQKRIEAIKQKREDSKSLK